MANLYAKFDEQRLSFYRVHKVRRDGHTDTPTDGTTAVLQYPLPNALRGDYYAFTLMTSAISSHYITVTILCCRCYS